MRARPGADSARNLPPPLLVGPGERLAPLPAVLAALAAGESAREPAATPVSDLAELLATDAPRGRLLVDADHLPLEDVGIVARYLDGGGAGLLVTGSDPGAAVARRLLSRAGARWLAWPLDVEQLAELAAGRGEAGERGEHRAQAERDPDAHGAGDATESLARDLAAIEAILRAGEAALPLPPAAPEAAPPPETRSAGREARPRRVPGGLAALAERVELSPEELEAFVGAPLEDTGERAPEQERERSRPGAVAPQERDAAAALPAPPPWYRRQVADLADRAQRLDLSLVRAREARERAGEAEDGVLDQPLEELGNEVFGLVQFTRTLGYLAAPPPRGSQEIALSTLLEELLGGLAGADPESPRYLFRAGDPAVVRSDKSLLVQAFDALFQVAAACSGAADVVRVSLDAAEGDPRRLRLLLTFPAGPLEDVPLERILAPYGLRPLLPRIGPNALAAAARILQGQGGTLAVGPHGDPPPRRLAFEVVLPRG